MENYKEKYESLLILFEESVEVNRKLLIRISELELEVTILKSQLKNRPNSKNSSMPPSVDFTRQINLNPNRAKSGKKPDGQSGHKVNFLKMRDHNDETIHHIPSTCQQCGYELQSVEEKELNRGQVIYIPVARTKVAQHINDAKKCT